MSARMYQPCRNCGKLIQRVITRAYDYAWWQHVAAGRDCADKKTIAEPTRNAA